jgi:hypothetical protein
MPIKVEISRNISM